MIVRDWALNRSRLRLPALLVVLALAFAGCIGGAVLLTRLPFAAGPLVRSLTPVASLTCQRYVATSGSAARGAYCAWYMGADTVLFIQGPPEQVIASYAHRQLLLRAGPVQFAIGAQTTEDENPVPPPLFPIYFGFSLFLEGLP